MAILKDSVGAGCRGGQDENNKKIRVYICKSIFVSNGMLDMDLSRLTSVVA